MRVLLCIKAFAISVIPSGPIIFFFYQNARQSMKASKNAFQAKYTDKFRDRRDVSVCISFANKIAPSVRISFSLKFIKNRNCNAWNSKLPQDANGAVVYNCPFRQGLCRIGELNHSTGKCSD